jgi:hypothetical protein
MFVKYKIGLASITGDTYFNIPIDLEYQIVDNSELIERVFVDVETEKSVNPILDYDKSRFTPVDNLNNALSNIRYNLNFIKQNGTMASPTYYSDIEFIDTDISLKKDNFLNSYLNLNFYDTDNAMTQNLTIEMYVYTSLSKDDYYPKGIAKPLVAGQPKPANQIPVSFLISNPIIETNKFYEGFYLYDYKDEYIPNGLPKSLYMKASYFNGKTGKITNFMTENTAYPINTLVNKLYTKYDLFRNQTGFYYKIDLTYSQNVSKTQNLLYTNNPNIIVNLYQTQVL